MKKRSLLYFLIISLVLHGIGAGLLFWIKQNKPNKDTIAVEYKAETPIQLLEIKTIKENDKKPKSLRKQSVASSTKLASTLDNFKPHFNFGNGNSATTGKLVLDNNGDTFGISPNKDDSNAAWGSGSASFGRVQDYLLFKKIYDYVDGSLFFPSFFVRRNIQGVTNARLVLNSAGTCDWEKIRIYGNDAFMQIYILSVLKKACLQSFKPFIKDRIVTNVDLSFHFAITETTTEDQVDKNRFIVGNTLMFYRNSYKSVMQWEFGPFQGIFPVPAVYLNLPWIQENWEKLMNHKDPISEFKKEFGS